VFVELALGPIPRHAGSFGARAEAWHRAAFPNLRSRLLWSRHNVALSPHE
jgi:hypothetical protein